MHLSSAENRHPHSGRIAETDSEAADLRHHLSEIVEGLAFKGSHRSGQFLTYIVEQAIAGHLESLKERVIGVELFGRSPSYDTGDDAIVRVTASDVRRRLLQHYGRYGNPSGLRISLPLGSYIPVVTREEISPSGPATETAERPEVAAPPSETASPPIAIQLSPPLSPSRRGRAWALAAGVLLLGLLVFASGLWMGRRQAQKRSPLSGFPWSVFIHSAHATQIITSDPTIADVQELTGRQISVSDYANASYLPPPGTITAETLRICRLLLTEANPAAVDTTIAVKIAALAEPLGEKLHVHAARLLRMEDLKTDDNFIFLGSPRSNPWTALFADQLDFRFVFSKEAGQEFVQNFRPRPHEMTEYWPTALGGGTGQSFAIVALVQNLDQNGQVLLLAGADAEGTEAAGQFVTDTARFAGALRACGIGDDGPLQHFEFLLRLSTMAGSPNDYEVLACHLLSAFSPH
jgi:hypothetical protein